MLSEAQLSLIRRASAIECELERLDAALSLGEAVDLDSYGRATSHLRRLFVTLGLGRIPGNTQRRAYSRAHSVTSGGGLRNSSASVTSPTSRGRRSRPNVSNKRRKCEVARP